MVKRSIVCQRDRAARDAALPAKVEGNRARLRCLDVEPVNVAPRQVHAVGRNTRAVTVERTYSTPGHRDDVKNVRIAIAAEPLTNTLNRDVVTVSHIGVEIEPCCVRRIAQPQVGEVALSAEESMSVPEIDDVCIALHAVCVETKIPEDDLHTAPFIGEHFAATTGLTLQHGLVATA